MILYIAVVNGNPRTTNSIDFLAQLRRADFYVVR